MDTPWDILYADDLQIADKTRFGAEKRLSEWTFALEKFGLRVSRDKTEDLSTDEATNASIDNQKKTRTFKYLGSTLNEETNCGAPRTNGEKCPPIIYDKTMPERLKHRVYETSPTSTVVWSGNLGAASQGDRLTTD